MAILGGVIGLNILADRPNFDWNGTLALVRALRPAYCVVLNNGAFAQAIMPYVGMVIFRRKRSDGSDANNDDNAQAFADPEEFARLRDEEAPKGALLYGSNEPGKEDAERLNAWNIEFIKAARARTRRACINNWATGNPEPQHWALVAPSIALNNEVGGVNGAHEYWMGTPNSSIAYPYHVGRSFDAVKRYGGLWVVTESGANQQKPGTSPPQPDPHAGWETFRSEGDYADDFSLAVPMYAARNMGLCIFSDPDWDNHRFGIRHATGILHPRLTVLNQSFNVTSGGIVAAPNVVIPASPGDPAPACVVTTGLRLRADAGAQIIRALDFNEVVTIYPKTQKRVGANDWVFLRDKHDQPGWSAPRSMTGETWIEQIVPTERELVNLDLIYVSQLGANAGLRNNDCGIACALSAALTRLLNVGYGAMPVLTVNNLISLSPLRDGDSVVSMNDLEKFLGTLGVPAAYSDRLTPDAIASAVQSGKPVLVLINYVAFDPTQRFGHYALVVGLAENDTFILNDPYLKGEGFRLSKARLETGLTDFKSADGKTFASKPYQGYVLQIK